MPVLIQIPTGLSSPELEILLAAAQSAIDAGSPTIIVKCFGGYGYACSLNIYGLKSICKVCKKLTSDGISELDGVYQVIETPAIPRFSKSRLRNEHLIRHSRSSIKNYHVEGVDVGQAVYSSYIGLTRDQDLEGYLSDWSLNELMKSSTYLIPWYRDLLKEFSVVKVIIYNGRQNQYRSLLRVAQQLNIPVDVMEFSGQHSKCVYLFKNELPQDLDVLEKSINSVCNNLIDVKNRQDIAYEYYSFKRSGGVVNDIRSYVSDQESGLLPKNWEASKHNVVIFNSSEDEYAAIGGEYDKTLYKNQTEAITRLCESTIGDKGIVLWLRIHPNLSKVHWTFAKKLLELESIFPNVHVIPGTSPISSYALLDASDKVLSFGSTMGIEAAYWGKPSVLVGRCVYEKFGSVYAPRSHQEVVNLILNRNLLPLPVEGALKIALFWKAGGSKISNFGGDRSNGFNFRGVQFKKTIFEVVRYNAYKIIEKFIFGYMINYGVFAIGNNLKRIK